jgi:RNA polymerase sigma factor (sigma-70 family)
MVSTEPHLVPKLTRGSLLERLRERCDHASWEEFFDQYWQLIYHVARRAGLSEADAEDCVQETVVEVVDSLPAFERERPGSFRAWLCKVTRTQVAMFYRKQERQRKREAVAEDLWLHPENGSGTDWDTIWDEEWQRNLLQAALERVKRQVSPRQFQIFQCHVLEDWSVREVARHLDVSAGMVYVTKHRVNSALKRELQILMEDM